MMTDVPVRPLGVFDGGIDEGTAAKSSFPTPVSQDAEHCVDAGDRIVSVQDQFGLEMLAPGGACLLGEMR